MADQRHELDHVSQQARRLPGRGVRGHGQAHRRQRVAHGQHRVGHDGQRLGQHRPHAALPVQLHRARPPGLREEQGHAHRQEGGRHLPPDRRRDRRVRLPRSSRRHHPVHQRPRVPVVHPRDQHGPHAPRDGLPGVQRLQRGVRPDAVGPRAQGGAQGLRHAGPAREGLDAAVGQLVQDEGVHHDPLHRRGRLDQPGRPRDRRHRRPRRLREGARRGHGPARELRRPQDRQEADQGDREARRGLQGQVRRHGARHHDGARPRATP